MRDVREAQDRTAWQDSLLDAQLAEPTVRAAGKRFASGPLPLVAAAAAPPTLAAAQRLLLQSEQVAAQLALAPSIAGPGSVD